MAKKEKGTQNNKSSDCTLLRKKMLWFLQLGFQKYVIFENKNDFTVSKVVLFITKQGS